MPDLRFQVEGAAATPNAAVPQISFQVRVTNSEPEPIHSIALRVQVQIDPVRRRYTPVEQEHLKELFGEPERWSKSLHPLLWTNANVTVTGFTGNAVIDVPAPCTFDFNVAMTKYIYGLEEGELPVSLMFSGTVFHAGRIGLQVAQIPWDRDATFRLPVRVWKEMMDSYYPNVAWICLHRDVFDRVAEYKARHSLVTWEQAFERMLGLAAEAKA
ncbi:MAG: hypothetical protein JOY79_04460 [Acidobacteriaceae bacterium]|nr:hypothetical protein [Acidobacteriaceae bacterium]